MRKSKLAALAVMLTAAIMLSGCQLALEEKEYSPDRLVGISVRLSSGGAKYIPREEYFDRRQPHEPDGEVVWLKHEYNDAGELMISAEYDPDGWFEPVHQGVHMKDESEERTLETTIYVAEEMFAEEPWLEMEHVYQRADGTLYAIDCGSNYSGHLDGLGLTVSQTQTVTGPDGKKKSETTTIKLNVKHTEIIRSAEAVEMRGTGEEIARHKLTGQEEIWVSAETEWLLIEETLADGSIRRSAVNGPLNNETFFIRIPELPGVCIRETYTIRTPGALSDETRPG